MSTKKIAVLSVFAALSIVFLFIIRIPLFPVLPFLVYDLADIPIIICTMLYGAAPGLLITAVVCLIQGFLLSADGIIGVVMHFVATGTLVLVFGLMFKKFSGLKGCIVSAVTGVIAWVTVMALFNILITPLFMKIAIKDVLPLILPVIVPFNIIKAGVNTALAVSFYYFLKKLLKNKFV